MLSNTAVRSAGLQGCAGRGIGRTPIDWEMTSVAAMMLAADRIAANVLAAKPPLRDALYRKILRRFGRVAPVARRSRRRRSTGVNR